jgi:hypothetical protein
MNSSSLSAKIRQIFLRTQIQLIGAFVGALVVFLVEYSAFIIQFLERGSDVEVGLTGKTISGYIVGFLQKISDLPHADDVITGLFWATAAGLCYAAFIAISDIYTIIHNEIADDVNYSKVTRSSVFKVMIVRFSEKILAISAFIGLVAASIFLLVPFWMDMLARFVHSGFQLSQAGFFALGFFGLAANIYVVWSAAYFTWVYEETV